MARIGIIGKGYFGKRLLGALGPEHEVRFVTGKELAIDFDIDWVIVATSTESHYELVKLFLEKRVNVFCEKPLTLSHRQSSEVVQLAKANGANLYVDDVFLYRDTFRAFKARYSRADSFDIQWFKHGSFGENICNSLVYHDLYLLIDLLGGLEPTGYASAVNRLNHKSFSFEHRGSRLSFLYNRNADTLLKQWQVDGTTLDFSVPDNDALAEMLALVLSGGADYAYNNALALETQEVLDWLLADVPTAAVVGAGIFGISAALKLDAAGLAVSLYEKNDEILACASSINQYRLHRGYHYPRSKETALSAKAGTVSFLEDYPCKSRSDKQYYAIAAMGSHTDDRQFEEFMDGAGLEYERTDLDIVDPDSVSGIYKVEEELFDPVRLAEICGEKLTASGVGLLCGQEFTRADIAQYDYVINATYSGINYLLDELSQLDYQFELCEKPVVRLPDEYRGIGVVICDGPFNCLDPYGETPYHVLGNVVHAIHATNTGKHPVIPPEFAGLLNNGIVGSPPITKIESFLASAKKFFPGMEHAVHIGSMFTVRAVLPNHDYDDARPSLVTKHSEGLYSIFSGKISTCVDSANDLVRYISLS